MPVTINGTTGISTPGISSTAASTFSEDLTLAGASVEILNNSGRIVVRQSGSVIQVVSTTKTDTFSTTSATMIDVTGLSVSITPTSSSSKILIMLSMNLAGQNANAGAAYQFVRGSTAICIGDLAGSRPQASGGIGYIADSNSFTTVSGTFLDSPATTSSTTYKIQVVGEGNSSGAYVNRTQTDGNGTNYFNARTASTITVMEIAA